MKVAIYCRYSSHNQQETSIEGQLKYCHAFCEQNGHTIVEEYIDRAMSGTNDKRPSFQRMINDSYKKVFQAVLVYQLDRFARNRDDSYHYRKILKKNGVGLLSVKENISDGPIGLMVLSVVEGYNEFFSMDNSQKIKRGMDINAEKCLSTGGVIPLGYVVGADKHFQIDPNTAPIIRYIFENYANGKTVVQICEHLNERGYKTSTGSSFNKNSLRSILKNKKYIGVYTYKGHEIPDGIPRIVSDEVFDKVAEVMDKNKKAPARARAKEEYLLTTKPFCGHCKEMMTGFSGTGKLGKTYRYYECKGTKKKRCGKKRVQKEYIENLIIEECKRLLTKDNINRIAREVVSILKSERDLSNLNRLKKMLVDNERKHRNIMDAVSECEISSVRFSLFQELQKLEEAKVQIERDIAEEEYEQPMLTIPQIKFFLNSLKNGDMNDIKYRKTLIKIFVNKIYLYDDRLTIIFNSGEKPVTINDILLSEIEQGSQVTEDEKGLFINSNAPP